MPKLHRNLADARRESRRGSEFYRLMYAPDKPPQFAPEPEKAKRASPVRDPLVPSEHQSQAAVISWWALACNRFELPRFALMAIPNGGARDVITGARLKAEGVRAGVPDLFLAAKRENYGGLFIEMKKPGKQPSDAQREVITYLNRAGYAWNVCWTAESAQATITNYLSFK